MGLGKNQEFFWYFLSFFIFFLSFLSKIEIYKANPSQIMDQIKGGGLSPLFD